MTELEIFLKFSTLRLDTISLCSSLIPLIYYTGKSALNYEQNKSNLEIINQEILKFSELQDIAKNLNKCLSLHIENYSTLSYLYSFIVKDPIYELKNQIMIYIKLIDKILFPASHTIESINKLIITLNELKDLCIK